MTSLAGTKRIKPAGIMSARHSRSRARERRQTLLFYTAMLCVCVVSMLECISVSIRIGGQIVYARPAVALGFVCVFFLLNDKEVFRRLRGKPYVNIILFWGIFCVLMFISAALNKSPLMKANPVTMALLFQMYLLDTLGLVLYALAMERTMEFLDFMIRFAGVLLVLTDAMMFGGVYFTDGSFQTYLVGTKFDAVYLHMNFAALFLTRIKLSGRKGREVKLSGAMLMIFMIIILIIGLRVDCNTGVIGAMLMFGMIYVCDRWPEMLARPLASPRVLAGTLLMCTLFAYYVSWLLNLPVVVHLVVDKMGRSLTLTGRTIIYAQFSGMMQDRWTWGFGYGTAYEICRRYLGYADVQNALLQWILQIGIPGTAAMASMLYCIMVFYRKKNSMTSAAPLLVLIYVYILLGTVEITLNYNFFLWMLVVFMLACSDPKKINDMVIRPMYTPRSTKRRKRLID